jgi:hypothetical protein
MVVFVLYVKADLDGVDTLSLDPTAQLCISVRNPLSPEYDYEVREKVIIDPSELEEPAFVKLNSKGHHQETEPPCHFALKWEGAPKRSTVEVLDRDSSVTLLESSSNNLKQATYKSTADNGTLPVPREMTGRDSGNFVPILRLECQGVEPYQFHVIGGEFSLTNKAGAKYEEVDLSEGGWNKVDECTGTCAVTNFESKFE